MNGGGNARGLPRALATLAALAALPVPAGCAFLDKDLEPKIDAEPGDGGNGTGDGGFDRSPEGGDADAAAAEAGPPLLVGCADGTREGFSDRGSWPKIAGCSGGWSLPGLLSAEANLPHCGRAGGNTGLIPTGSGCAAADLCASGWHLCAGPDEVARFASSQCEGSGGTASPIFFAARTGSSSSGLCTGAASAENNLLGCGGIGDAADGTCAPLNRSLGFADCAATGVWSCGGTDDWQREAAVVTKKGPDLGGVLCCEDT